MQITKEQLQTILSNAPAGVDKVSVIENLYSKGVSVQGVDSYDAQQFISTYKSAKIGSAMKQQEDVETIAGTDTNLGTGFNPSFESDEDDNAIQSIAKTIGNVPKSSFMLGKDIVTAVANPIDTLKSIKTLIGGASGNLAQNVLENTDFGQTILKKASESRVSRGLPALQQDASGRFVTDDTEAMQIADQVGNYYKERYGSWDGFKEAAVEDPAGVLGDLATVVSGTGIAVRQGARATGMTRVMDAGSSIQRVGNAIEPTSAISRGVGAVTDTVGQSLPGRIISESAPTPTRFAEGQVVKALDLTQGDVARITQKTGNDVTDFVARNNLLKETPEEIAIALDNFNTRQYNLVRTEVAKVADVYSKANVPRVGDALGAVRDVVDGIPGLEETAGEVNRLLAQDTYSLTDIQRVKELLDANASIYTRAGEARGVSTARGLDQVRQDLRSFIEDEVTRTTNGATDIRKINNDVATSRELSDAIEMRETRGLTRQYASVFDGILGVSAWGATGDPILAAGIVIGKKMTETPSFRIALARVLKAHPVEKVSKIAGEMADGLLSPASKAELQTLINQARENAQFIQSGAQAVDVTEQETDKIMQGE